MPIFPAVTREAVVEFTTGNSARCRVDATVNPRTFHVFSQVVLSGWSGDSLVVECVSFLCRPLLGQFCVAVSSSRLSSKIVVIFAW